MKTIVCYGDSNTWGFKPERVKPPIPSARFDADVRWTGVLQRLLGERFRIEEEGLNGRTTAFDDPFDSQRNGLRYLDCCMSTKMPVDLVIFMLGTNDVKEHFGVNAYYISCGMEQLILKVKNGEYGPNGEIPKMLIVAPAKISDNISYTWLGNEFGRGCLEKSSQLSFYYQNIAELHGCYFVDASQTIVSSPLDAVHLDEENHNKLAHLLYEKIVKIL